MAFPVAVVQMTVEPGEVDHNRETASRMAAQAAAQGARLILLPEACISDSYRGAAALAEPIPGPSTEMLSRVAGEALIALPLLERQGEAVFSSCALLTREGVQGVARKTHLSRDVSGLDSFRDADVVAAGAELSLFDLGDLRVGVLLGFDAEFPEVFRALALRGADLVLVAQNCVEPDLKYLAAMAQRNRLPLLVANRLGFRRMYPAVPEFSASSLSLLQDKDGSFLARCKGGSAIVEADGRVVAQPSLNVQHGLDATAGAPPGPPIANFQEDELLTASFRLDEARVQRLTSPYLAERREELYSVPRAPAEKEKKPPKPRTPRARKTKPGP